MHAIFAFASLFLSRVISLSCHFFSNTLYFPHIFLKEEREINLCLVRYQPSGKTIYVGLYRCGKKTNDLVCSSTFWRRDLWVDQLIDK